MIQPVKPVGLSDEQRVRLLSLPRRVPSRMVLDTDTYNEIDDQFALVHVQLSPDRVNLEAVYAAPFHNDRSTGPADGMRKSFDEIQRILNLTPDATTPVFEGATDWLVASREPARSAASDDLIERAMRGPAPLYVVAIAAPTNVATAVLLEPRIAEHLVVVWLGGNGLSWPDAQEFNLGQDVYASQVLLDSGVALVHVPCLGTADRLTTTRAEVETHVRPCGALGALLADRYAGFVLDDPGRSKVIWDLAATGWLLGPTWTSTSLAPSPILTPAMTWSADPRRHLMLEVTAVDRDAIFMDLFHRLAAADA